MHTGLIGAAIGSGDFPGNWWIQYSYNFSTDFTTTSFDPVDLFHDCTTRVSPNCVVDTALVVTFFPSDADGNPIDGNGNRIPEPGSLLLIVAALGAGWLVRRRAAA